MIKRVIKTSMIAAVAGMCLMACANNSNKMKENEAKTMQQKDMMTDDKMKSDDMMTDDKMKSEDMMTDDKMKSEDMMTDDKMKSDDMMTDDKMKSDDQMMKDDVILYDKAGAENKKSGVTDMSKMEENMNNYDFNLEDLEGNYYKLSEHKGKKVYVKFWASWCSICLAGLEELNTLAGENNDFEVVTVVAPKQAGEKDKDSFKEWFKSLGYKNIKVLFDENGELLKHYGVRAYPSSVYIDSTGKEEKVRIGHVSADEIKETFMNIN